MLTATFETSLCALVRECHERPLPSYHLTCNYATMPLQSPGQVPVVHRSVNCVDEARIGVVEYRVMTPANVPPVVLSAQGKGASTAVPHSFAFGALALVMSVSGQDLSDTRMFTAARVNSSTDAGAPSLFTSPARQSSSVHHILPVGASPSPRSSPKVRYYLLTCVLPLVNGLPSEKFASVAYSPSLASESPSVCYSPFDGGAASGRSSPPANISPLVRGSPDATLFRLHVRHHRRMHPRQRPM